MHAFSLSAPKRANYIRIRIPVKRHETIGSQLVARPPIVNLATQLYISSLSFDGATHGRPQWGQGGCTCPHLEFEKMTSCAAVLQNTLKFSLAPPAPAIDTLYFSLKRAKKCKNFRLRLRRAEKWLTFCTALRKRVNFLTCWWFCPLWKNFCGRPC